MNSLKFWQSVLAVLWIFALLGGGYYFYRSVFSAQPCPVYVQSGQGSCGGTSASDRQIIQQNDFLRSDVTSPLGAALLEKEKSNLLR